MLAFQVSSLRPAFLAALCAALTPLGDGQTPSPSATATLAAPSCDTSGSCYVGLRASLSWFEAQTACTELGSGWNLASFVDDTTLSSAVLSLTCNGQLPQQSSYWIGLHDKACCNKRRASTQNRTYDGWSWSSGDDTTCESSLAVRSRQPRAHDRARPRAADAAKEGTPPRPRALASLRLLRDAKLWRLVALGDDRAR